MRNKLCVLCLSVALSAVADVAAADQLRTETVVFNMPEQPLEGALAQLAIAADIKLVYYTEVGAGLRAPAVIGKYTAAQALERILGATGLHAEYLDERTVAILGEKGADAASKRFPNGSGLGDARLQLARRDVSAAATPASGQDSKDSERAATSGGSPAEKLQEIVVTAQKRAQAIKDVPMSIVALSGEELDMKGINSTLDIALAVPGVAVQDRGGSSERTIFLRGLGNTRGSQTMVGIYLDELDVTSFPYYAPDLRVYDMERLEVLRGPQGTLYGSGAMGGVLRYITKKTNLTAFSGDAYARASFTEGGDPSETIGGSMNLPVVADRFGVRIAGFYENSGGWIDQPAASKSDINDQQLYSVRAKTLWRPTEAWEISAMAMVQKSDTGASNVGEDENGNFTQRFSRTTTPSGENDFGMYNLTATYSASKFQVLSSTGYVDVSSGFHETGYIAKLLGAPPGVPYDLLYEFSDVVARAFVQEMRVSSIQGGRLNWTAGATYRDAKLKTNSRLLFGLPGSVPVNIGGRAASSTESWAVFGEASVDLTRRLNLGAGLRYYSDRQENITTRQSGEFDQLSPRFFGKLTLTDDIGLYANVGKGFRSGGFNTALAIANGAPRDYESDLFWSYELGSKGMLFDKRMSFDVAAFYGDYQDAQDVGFVVINGLLVSLTGNLGQAVIKGVNWDLAVQLNDALSIGTGGEYLDGKYTKISAVSASQAVGDPLKFIPDYHANAWALYEFKWSVDTSGYLRLDYDRQGESEYRNRSQGPLYFSRSDTINMVNASLGWQRNNLSISLFARNLLDDRGYLDAESIELLAARSRPRTYGVNLHLAFD